MAGNLGLDGEHPSPGERVDLFKGAEGRWEPATIREYRAAIRDGLENFCRKPDGYPDASAALERLNAVPTRF